MDKSIRDLSKEKLIELVEACKVINRSDLGLWQVGSFLIEKIAQVTGSQRCMIFRIMPSWESVILVAGYPEEDFEKGKIYSAENELALFFKAVEGRSHLIIEDPMHDEMLRAKKELVIQKRVNAVLLMPLLIDEAIEFIISVDAIDDKKSFSEEDIVFCQILISQFNSYIQRESLRNQEKEKESLVTLGQAAGHMAHLIRNPLVSIGGFARRLKDVTQKLQEGSFWVNQSEIERIRKYAKQVAKEVALTENIFNEFIHFSGLGHNSFCKEINIDELLGEVQKEMIKSPLINGKEIDFCHKINPDLPLFEIDSDCLKKAFSAILINAVEAIEKKGRIDIKTKVRRSYISICIVNNGGCIAEELLDRIKQPFFTTKTTGTGLGLAMASRIVDSCGGSIKISNFHLANQVQFVIQLPF